MGGYGSDKRRGIWTRCYLLVGGGGVFKEGILVAWNYWVWTTYYSRYLVLARVVIIYCKTQLHGYIKFDCDCAVGYVQHLTPLGGPVSKIIVIAAIKPFYIRYRDSSILWV